MKKVVQGAVPKKVSPGILITFEGTEGAGKSTLMKALESRLRAAGFSVVLTREPGGNAVAERIRALILNSPMDPWTELFLYEAARAEHIAQTLRPALSEKNVVLCDRFTDSTLAYQGEARGLDWETIRKLNRVATQEIRPALKILVDIDPAAGLRDAQDPNRFEAEGVEFQKKVRRGFLRAMRAEPELWLKVRARSGTPEVMAQALMKKLLKRLTKLSTLKSSGDH